MSLKKLSLFAGAIAGTLLVSGTATAAGLVKAQLDGYEEVPAVSTSAAGQFTARVNPASIVFELVYGGLEGDVAQAHIHLGARGTNGGVSAFLCTNLGNGPPGTPACPASPGSVVGTIEADDVIGPSGQGISAGEFEELLAAIDAGAAYVNVHSNLFPGGEIRGQVRRGRGPR